MKTKIFSLVLIIALVGLYSSTVYPQNKSFPEHQFFKGKMLEKLNLTDEQKNKIEDARLAHQKQMIDLKANLQKKLLALKELRLKGNLDRNSVLAAVKEINQAKNEIALARANNMMDFYEILTPEQRKTVKDQFGFFHEFGQNNRWNMREGRGHGEGNFGPMHKKMDNKSK